MELLVVLVADAGVEHRDDHAVAVGELPRVGHADLPEVPLVLVLRIVREARLRARRSSFSAATSSGELHHRVGLGDLDVGALRAPRGSRLAAGSTSRDTASSFAGRSTSLS